MEMLHENYVEEFSRERLMEDIRQYPCIYDKYDKDYPDKNAKNNAWSAIAAKYGITPADADKKYKTMRSSYTRYLKKKRNTPPGAKVPPLPLAFVNLDWLASHIDHKETSVKYAVNEAKDDFYSDYMTDGEDAYHSSYGEIMREENNSGDLIEVPSSNIASRARDSLKPEQATSRHVMESLKPTTTRSQTPHVKDNLRPDPLPTPHVTTPEYQSIRATSPPVNNHSNLVSSTQTPQANCPKTITMYYNTPNDSPSDTVFNLIPLESVKPTTTTPPLSSESNGKRKRIECDDEDELFFLSLVPTLKRLGPRNKTIAKMRIQQVLFDLEFPESG
ncbi:uncharacterized protein LOC114521085 [Dendronephthya gigantea]|uniref:uncharacterized protein LOC114521085 n=1 Tax=Dendronephthya gigantea TaxID=151771 RepID=UPI00106B3827|nr:uncharacterized protein LOC114521085 [Dendronephthya gigantea]XP_028397295.1 uncharacterized protein LOC114521085 [Dendronephthya gigantea]XP_028397296.1 uncharacterized protein LOC114521085 [Dendronephthya gigantea]XP_028397297.1 uncharacterized protein LOC114521085 [Dendronephthya gigantea]